MQIPIWRTCMINISNTLNKFVIINFPSLICKNLGSTISIFTPFFEMTLFVSEEIDSAAVYKSNHSKWFYVKNCQLRPVPKNSYLQKLRISRKTSKPYHENRVCTFTSKIYSHWNYRNVNKISGSPPIILNNKQPRIFLMLISLSGFEKVKLHSCQYEKLFMYLTPNENCHGMALCTFRFVKIK